jgi:hypothetical protein
MILGYYLVDLLSECKLKISPITMIGIEMNREAMAQPRKPTHQAPTQRGSREFFIGNLTENTQLNYL